MAYALFKDGKQIGKAWPTKPEAGLDAFRRDLFKIAEMTPGIPDSGSRLQAFLAPGYEIREVETVQ